MPKIIKEWHQNQKIKCQYIVDEDGIKDGDFREWNDNEKLIIQCNYVKGKIVGTKKFFNEKGDVEREIDFNFDGNAFIVKFYADEFTEKEARIVGVAYDIEHLTLSNILDSFKKLQGNYSEIYELNLNLNKQLREQKEEGENKKAKERNISQLAVGVLAPYSSKENRVTFS